MTESERHQNLYRGRSATHSSPSDLCSLTASPSPCRISLATHLVRHHHSAILTSSFGDFDIIIRRFRHHHSAISTSSFGDFFPARPPTAAPATSAAPPAVPMIPPTALQPDPHHCLRAWRRDICEARGGTGPCDRGWRLVELYRRRVGLC